MPWLLLQRAELYSTELKCSVEHSASVSTAVMDSRQRLKVPALHFVPLLQLQQHQHSFENILY